MVKAKTKALNLLLPETLSDWFTQYAKTQNKTKTEIICSLLQGLQNGEAYSDVDKPVDNSVDGIESIVKDYLDNHLQDYVENILHNSKQADVVNPVDDSVESAVVNPVDDYVDSVVDDSVVNPVDENTIAATDKPKTNKRSPKPKATMRSPKYTRDDLESLPIGELRKKVTAVIPLEARKDKGKSNLFSKPDCITMLMDYQAKIHT